MPAAEVVGQLACRAFDRPGLDLPVVALDVADEVHQLTAPNWIMQDVAARPEPIRRQHLCDVSRKAVHRHNASPGEAAGELGSIGAEQALADLRVNAVRSDREGCSRRYAGIEADFDVLLGLGDVDAAPREMDRIRFQAGDRVNENTVEVAPMKQQVRSAV